MSGSEEENPTVDTDEDPSLWTRAEIVAPAVLGGMFLAAMILPFVASQLWGFWIGVAVGVGVPIAWIMLLPNSCMNGGLHFAILAIIQSGSALIWLIAGVIAGIARLF